LEVLEGNLKDAYPKIKESKVLRSSISPKGRTPEGRLLLLLASHPMHVTTRCNRVRESKQTLKTNSTPVAIRSEENLMGLKKEVPV
jgi:hypothetical protein